MNPATLAQFQSYGEKIASELVAAEAGKDAGLLPVNSFLCLMEETLATERAPEAIQAGVRQARRWMDGIFDTTGVFSEEDLERFGRWAVWWKAALDAISNGGELPKFSEEASLERSSSPLPSPPQNCGGEGEVQRAQEAVAASRGCSTPLPSSPHNFGREGEVRAAREEPVLRLNLEEDREFLAQFVSESMEHLQNIEQGVLQLENNPSDAETLNLIFRGFHTFKGGSGFLNLTAIHDLAHELETLLDLARQRKLGINRLVIELILTGADTLKQFISEICARLGGNGAGGPIVIPTLDLIERIRAAPAYLPPPQAEAVAAAGSSTSPGEFDTMTDIASATIKVDKVKLDNLVDLMGEVMLAQARVAQHLDSSAPRSEKLNQDLASLERVTKELKYNAMSLRMVPIRKTFQKMHRLARDVAAKAGKEVHLVVQGEETELDRALVEEVNDPLVHMIRNSIDHGIEKPEARRERGKPERGTIRLNAYHQGGSIVIEIRDDGNGLNREKILAKATAMGLIKPGQQLAEKEIFNLIMAPGFSTAEQVTDLSGRGVGLDVVRRNVENLHGKIEIQSTPGQGSIFSIHLPLTMAIIDGLIAGVGEQRFIFPTLSVSHSFRPGPGAIKTVQGRGEMIDVRGKMRPVLRLQNHLGMNPNAAQPAECLAVLIEAGGQSRCVLVDQLLGKQEVIIKSLGETFRRQNYVKGAAILNDGRVALILDPYALVCLESAPLEAAA